MRIRKAIYEDARAIAEVLFFAMEEIIYTFIREHNSEKAVDFLYYFVQDVNNQYSYQNCWVVEGERSEIMAAACVYDGASLYRLREKVLTHIKEGYGDLPFVMEDETEIGEFYIDSIGVNPVHRGKGIGTILLKFLIEEYVEKQQQTLGLLVEEENTNAKRLYLKMGFKPIRTKFFAQKVMVQLQIKP
ncbi:MAG: GNAT family N-acetyltransferase [Pedobacter sp.]|nr:MAG: GNAT family N-acetyltransferase [Pedobacter sp.]